MSGLLQHSAEERERVRTKVRKSQAQIEREIEENEGIYPYNKGRVTQAELCRRAGIGMATLQGLAHKDSTRVEVNAWLARIKVRMVQGHRRVRRAVTDRAEAWKQAYHELQDGWTVAELEHVHRRARFHELELKDFQRQARVQELEAELAQTRRELTTIREELDTLKASPGKVVRIPSRRPTR